MSAADIIQEVLVIAIFKKKIIYLFIYLFQLYSVVLINGNVIAFFADFSLSHPEDDFIFSYDKPNAIHCSY